MGFTPRPTDSAPCGSKSTSSTRRPYSASAAPRFTVVVVLPTPPFWLQSAITRAGPCEVRGAGTGKEVSGRPVGPSAPLASAVSGTVVRGASKAVVWVIEGVIRPVRLVAVIDGRPSGRPRSGASRGGAGSGADFLAPPRPTGASQRARGWDVV